MDGQAAPPTPRRWRPWSDWPPADCLGRYDECIDQAKSVSKGRSFKYLCKNLGDVESVGQPVNVPDEKRTCRIGLAFKRHHENVAVLQLRHVPLHVREVVEMGDLAKVRHESTDRIEDRRLERSIAEVLQLNDLHIAEVAVADHYRPVQWHLDAIPADAQISARPLEDVEEHHRHEEE